MADPWAAFKDAPQDDPWAAFADAQQPAPQAAPAPRRGIPDQFEAMKRFTSKQAPFAVEGLVGAVPGLPGDVESLGRLGLSMVSNVSRDTLLPTSTQTTNEMFGEPKTEDQARGRMFGSIFAPLGAKAGALEDAARIATQKSAALTAARQLARSPGGRANEILAATLARDKLTPENAATAIQQFGDKPVAIADLGPATARKARAVNTLEGAGSDTMSTFLGNRQAEQHGRLLDDITTNLAQGGDIYGMGKRMMADRDAAAKPLYREAYQANQNVASPKLDRILETPAGKAALASARTKMQNDMTLMGVPDAELKDQALEAMMEGLPRQGVASGLKLRTWDYVKQALDDQIGAKVRAGEKGDVRILSGLKNELVRELDNLDVTARAGPNSTKAAGGAYARARAAYSGPTQSTEALESGGSFLKMSTGEIADTLKGMSPSDQEFFRIGAAQALRDTVDATRDSLDAAQRIFGTKASRERITAVFGKAAADKMAVSMGAENLMTGTKRFIGNQSATADKAAEVAEGMGGVAQDAARGFASGGFRGAIVRPVMNRAQEGIATYFQGMPPDVRAALAQRLTATGSDAQQVMADLLSQRNTIQNARIVPGSGANVPRIDPRVIGALLAGSAASKMGQQ